MVKPVCYTSNWFKFLGSKDEEYEEYQKKKKKKKKINFVACFGGEYVDLKFGQEVFPA